MMTYFVYILTCADTSLYVGCTNNLEKRIHEHNHLKSGAHYTKIRRPVVLVYSEQFATISYARAREAEIKTWPREKKVKLVQSAPLHKFCLSGISKALKSSRVSRRRSKHKK